MGLLKDWVAKLLNKIFNLNLFGVLYSILTFAAAGSLFAVARARRRGRAGEMIPFLALVPVFWACFLLITTFTEHPVEPVIPIFAYDLLASCFILLALYLQAASMFGKKALATARFASLGGMYFISVVCLGRAFAVIAGKTYYLRDAPFRMTVFGAIFLYLLAETWGLFKRSA